MFEILINKDQLCYFIKIGWRHIYRSKCDAHNADAQTRGDSPGKLTRTLVWGEGNHRDPESVHVELKQAQMSRV